MNSTRIYILAALLSGLVWQPSLFAQVLRVQQPVVQKFSTGTTVSVPDRGSALLGGVNSGASWSRQVGPFRRGSLYGHSFQSSTSSVGVYIHDFEAMDRMLLNSAPLSSKYARRNSQDNLKLWKQQIFSQRSQSPTQRRSSHLNHLPQNSTSPNQDALAKSERFYKLGQSAEKKHASPNIAILHYRMAEKYGSTKATARLQKLRALKAKSQ